MRLLLVLLVVISLTAISFDNSYAQTPQQIFVYAQIEIQDSNGNLVAYLESGNISITDLNAFNRLIDSRPDLFHKSVITVNDQNYDLIKTTNVVVHTYPTIVSNNQITSASKGFEVVVTAYHDGYPVLAGDKVTTNWTIIRPSS